MSTSVRRAQVGLQKVFEGETIDYLSINCKLTEPAPLSSPRGYRLLAVYLCLIFRFEIQITVAFQALFPGWKRDIFARCHCPVFTC
ncbi:hypothetical protein GPEL0_01f3161 [Geoanaerobacter pelophilus]|uniref:Uncharacterized protein n=1 Tax=Geoanaerobacter pelophilus TaxID=60036 RepID=A0ABQ0MJV9_9BACT|nr:hypothetical protein GPEL0_01f3161 [Geoanaerobacter pelophilus]